MTTTHTTTGNGNGNDQRTLREVSADYAADLMLAVLAAGEPGRVTRAIHPAGSVEASSGPHSGWHHVRIAVAGTEILVYCVPTSQGVVLTLATVGGELRCLPTWERPATEAAPLVLGLARALAVTSSVAVIR